MDCTQSEIPKYEFHDRLPEPNIIKLKRAIEKLKYHCPQKDYLDAVVTFDVCEGSNGHIYAIQYRHNSENNGRNYFMGRNFHGGCSQSHEFLGSFDLDDLFVELDNLYLDGIENIKFTMPRYVMPAWLMNFLF